MPKLVFAVACQRAITSQDGLLTLVDVVERLSLKGAVESDDLMPSEFYLVTHWRLLPEDREFGHEFRFRTYLPSGKLYQEKILPTYNVAEPHTSHRHIYRIRGFPVGWPGVYVIQVSARTAGSNGRWHTSGSYPIEVEHHPASVSESTSE